MDKDELDRSLARRLLTHIEHHTTDMAVDVYEVPADIFTAEPHLRDELDVLFLDRPLVLSLSGALPRPGTYTALDVCDTPIVLTRGGDGQVRALANVCAHRGVRVVDGRGDGRRLTCPFHAWVYDLQGRLVGVPVADGFEGMCREDKGLIELPVAEKYGLIVGRLRPGDPVDVDEYLGPELAEELAALDFAGWEQYLDTHVHHVAANWKTTLDTFRENYHFNYLHRDTLAEYAYGGVLTFDAFGPHVRNSSAIRSIDELRDRPERDWDAAAHISHQYCFFPNTCVSFDRRHIELWQILPVDAHRSAVLHTVFKAPGLSEAETTKLVEMAPWICDAVVDREDFWVAARTEPGLSTGLTRSVVFGRNEPAPQHLHRGFLAAIDAARAQRRPDAERPVRRLAVADQPAREPAAI